jgi:Na+/melibiose symporter-like transporter
MGLNEWLLSITTILFWYAAGGCWLLQVVAYPTYSLVGVDEFVPFHVDFGKRLLRVFVGPAVLACIGAFLLLFLRPQSLPFWVAALIAACGAIILATTMLIEVPKHNALDRDGKSEVLIQGLVQNNLPRAISWTIGGILLAYYAFGG